MGKEKIFVNLILHFLCLISGFALQGFKQISHFEQIAEEFQNASLDDLIVFDIDYVLLIPKDLLLRPCGHAKLCQFFQEFNEKKTFLFNKMLVSAEEELLNEQAPQIIREWQEKGIKVMALTARRSGIFEAENLEDLRIRTLKKFGFDFRHSFSETLIEFRKECPDNKPLFKHGCLFSNKESKGEALKMFLERIDWKPKKVFFVDDHTKWLDSMQNSLSSLGIECILLQDMEAYLIPEELDHTIADFQLQYLLDRNEWVSDERAKASFHLMP